MPVVGVAFMCCRCVGRCVLFCAIMMSAQGQWDEQLQGWSSSNGVGIITGGNGSAFQPRLCASALTLMQKMLHHWDGKPSLLIKCYAFRIPQWLGRECLA